MLLYGSPSSVLYGNWCWGGGGRGEGGGVRTTGIRTRSREDQRGHAPSAPAGRVPGYNPFSWRGGEKKGFEPEGVLGETRRTPSLSRRIEGPFPGPSSPPFKRRSNPWLAKLPRARPFREPSRVYRRGPSLVTSLSSPSNPHGGPQGSARGPLGLLPASLIRIKTYFNIESITMVV